MDEPTNHLDIGAREELEEALMRFEGTMIVVSHDRYFRTRLATRVLDLGGYVVNTAHASDGSYGEKKRSGGDEYRAAKEKRSAVNRLISEKKTLEKRIADADARVTEINKMMDDPAVQSDHETLASIFTEKEQLEETLLELFEKLDENERNYRRETGDA